MTTCTEATRMTLSPYTPGNPDIRCVRTVDENGRHIGEHQGIEMMPAHPGDPTAPFPSMRAARPAYNRLVTWNQGGASSTRYHPDEPNPNCSCWKGGRTSNGHKPEDHRWTTCSDCGIIYDTTGNPRCSGCTYWQQRIDGYDKIMSKGERFVRPHHDTLTSSEGAWLYVWSPGHIGAFGGREFVVRWDDGTTVGPSSCLWSNGRIPWWLLDHFPPNATIETHAKVRVPGHTTGFNGQGTPLTYTGHPGDL